MDRYVIELACCFPAGYQCPYILSIGAWHCTVGLEEHGVSCTPGLAFSVPEERCVVWSRGLIILPGKVGKA